MIEIKRDYLPVSSLSLMGSCETKFLKSVLGELEVTPAMTIGKEKHAELVEGLPIITREKILEKIKSGKRCAFREVLVIDEKLKLIGSIDQLEFIGKVTNSKSEGIIIDDKYPIRVYDSLPLSYKLQLAGYTSATHNSKDFSKVCIIMQAKLVCRDSKTHDVLKVFNVGTDELDLWESNIAEVVKVAWEILNGEKEPEHRRFDVVNKEWVDCWCDK